MLIYIDGDSRTSGPSYAHNPPYASMNGLRLIEMQAILIELLENFEFSPAPGNINIIRGATGLMTPM
jgi:hypothetical protein